MQVNRVHERLSVIEDWMALAKRSDITATNYAGFRRELNDIQVRLEAIERSLKWSKPFNSLSNMAS
jgi:hypothetical protein